MARPEEYENKMFARFGGKPTPVGTVKLDVRRVYVALQLSDHSIDEGLFCKSVEAEASYDCGLRRVVLNLWRVVLAETADEVHLPATWWDHWKAYGRWCPAWFRRRWPPRIRRFSVNHYYPTMDAVPSETYLEQEMLQPCDAEEFISQARSRPAGQTGS